MLKRRVLGLAVVASLLATTPACIFAVGGERDASSAYSTRTNLEERVDALEQRVEALEQAR